MERSAKWELVPAHFGLLWTYVEDDKITDIDFNGRDLWITNTDNERIKVEDHGITKEFIEKFSHYIANNVSRAFNKVENLLEGDTDTLRISIVHESAAISGRTVCIRKTLPAVRMTRESIIEDGYCSKDILELLTNCAKARMNFVFCGEPGVGKTEGIKFFSQYIPSNERVITIEDTPELHYREINPDKDCVELIVSEGFSYTKAIKTSLRQNPKWLMLSEARSVEVKYLLESLSTGIKGFTTIHTDDARKIPDRILNMLESRIDADRMENDIYMFIDVGILIRKKQMRDGKVRRYIDQVCFFYRENGNNIIFPMVLNGEIVKENIPKAIMEKFERMEIKPFESEGGNNIEEKKCTKIS
ncbi:pilus assembly protein [Clostridium tyrobutyricum]|uniref:Type II/IV secretion system ATP hydrolase TadA/VirB11/CpaF, TadA subfamily n=1 Tax=Clostridium tyrobutyricum DIVETGP TaxID=1408889 RepID=W6N7F6_CLOTY|nr:ATPase, T2SS/T4P/T4SS family [Clostridium tyrobutyricum]AND85534.1 pilus assembly protein CpaF [Clostridium tyrobutyricum]ANP70069.1 pilus assembly protein [Clostridium tyrobutyricum]QNB65571.1 pilus assembly protein [Clostridium tyrobutyricum]CDL92436.1 Type II/IV secretion system ATP hydrolase TadA/VirB11/CpaF, TadA subfamily [Clostridium tyrobutyricum DIVETGP]